ncbi:hypothetical protein [Sulfitobacter aestuariivivens]|uniref:Uncharacterized protein n=1 Tax=Sulfitobacter aestuariivivens TaxID=2766981 RepID=A0A927D7G9_9RHOB|nr:hypothetical protein [Sulfitobacter aestuariivivens]MBD3665204.1 hypothetical protein [Sulfitobacter aestuariivivens]
MPVIGVIGALIGVTFEAVLLLFGGVFAGYVENRRKQEAKEADRPSVLRKPLISRKIVHWIAGACALVGVLGITASYVLFQPILRYAMDLASEKAGMSVDYAQASGSLLGGYVVLEGLALTREHETGLAFDLRIDRAEADVSLISLLGGTPTLTLGQVNGMSGAITPPLPSEEKKGLPKQRRPFRADMFAVKNVELQITPRGEVAYPVEIESAQVAPFRSGLAVFDLLFRSTMNARIAGQSLIVETRVITENGRETRWAFENVDASQLKRLLPKAPLTWVDDGRITVAVSDRWSLSEDYIDMDWRIATKDMRTSAPKEAGAAERVLAASLGKYLEKFGGDADFRYRFELDSEGMKELREGNLDAFWQKILSGVVKGGVDEDEAQTAVEEVLEEEVPGTFDRLKSIFKRDASGD